MRMCKETGRALTTFDPRISIQFTRIVYSGRYYTVGIRERRGFFFRGRTHSPRHLRIELLNLSRTHQAASRQYNSLSVRAGMSLTFENRPVRLYADKWSEIPGKRYTIFKSSLYKVYYLYTYILKYI